MKSVFNDDLRARGREPEKKRNRKIEPRKYLEQWGNYDTNATWF